MENEETTIRNSIAFLMSKDANFVCKLRDVQCFCKTRYGIDYENTEKIIAILIANGTLKQILVGVQMYLIATNNPIINQ